MLIHYFYSQTLKIKPHNKTRTTLYLDGEVVKYFKNLGKGYQSLMSDVLDLYVDYEEKGAVLEEFPIKGQKMPLTIRLEKKVIDRFKHKKSHNKIINNIFLDYMYHKSKTK